MTAADPTPDCASLGPILTTLSLDFVFGVSFSPLPQPSFLSAVLFWACSSGTASLFLFWKVCLLSVWSLNSFLPGGGSRGEKGKRGLAQEVEGEQKSRASPNRPRRRQELPSFPCLHLELTPAGQVASRRGLQLRERQRDREGGREGGRPVQQRGRPVCRQRGQPAPTWEVLWVKKAEATDQVRPGTQL